MNESQPTISGSLLLGLISAFKNVKAIANVEGIKMSSNIKVEEWYPIDHFFDLWELLFPDKYEHSSLLFQAGKEFIEIWYQGPGQQLITSGVDFLRLQDESAGYYQVVHGSPDDIGFSSLLEIDVETGIAIIEMINLFPPEFDKGVLFGGMMAPGDMEWVDVQSEEKPHGKLFHKKISVKFRKKCDLKTEGYICDLVDNFTDESKLPDDPAIITEVFWKLKSLNQKNRRENQFWQISNQLLDTSLDSLYEAKSELEAGKLDAESANQRKTRFLASASHDLRQPVHALELFSESLNNEKVSPQGMETLSYMKDCIASLNDLLGSLLDISRLDAGVVEPYFENIDAYQVINRVVNNTQGEAKAKGLNLRVYGKSLWVKTDATLLENSIRNLITNAIKYTNEGKVLIACRSRNNEVWIEVWDTGIGIAEEELSNIFEEFYQVNNAERDQKQGLGLGLSIITREMDILGHTLSLQSREGHGTMARIKLQRVYLGMPHIEQIAPVRLFDRLENKKVLIIDDEESILIATQSLVSNWGCVVETASNFEDASAICKRFIPDLIISDFRLRDHVTGIDVIEQLRLQLGHKVPAILITGDTAPDRLQQAKESELMLLHKPVKPVKLKVAMNMVLNTE